MPAPLSPRPYICFPETNRTKVKISLALSLLSSLSLSLSLSISSFQVQSKTQQLKRIRSKLGTSNFSQRRSKGYEALSPLPFGNEDLIARLRAVPSHMMPSISSSSPVIISFNTNRSKSCSPTNPNFTSVRRNTLQGPHTFRKSTHTVFKIKPPNTLRFIGRNCMSSNDVLFDEDSSFIYDLWDQTDGEDYDMGSPWEGAVIYQRNASISHIEYCTTLERLGLGKISTEVSRSRASVMGLRVTKAVKDFPLGTPVLISVDVTRKMKKLRLDGIVRTVITLLCQRCGEPTAESVFRNFSLLLTEEPVKEPADTIDMGVLYGEDPFTISGMGEEEEDEDASIDWDDRLHFPPGEKTIDISKHIRDIVHLEIVIDALCDPKCKGLCLKCGWNLNTSDCNCSQQETEGKGYGPFGGLRERMQKK